MTWVAVGTAAVGFGMNYINSQQAQKQQKKANKQAEAAPYLSQDSAQRLMDLRMRRMQQGGRQSTMAGGTGEGGAPILG